MFLCVSSPCPTPDRTPAVGHTAPDSSGSSLPSEETCPSESEKKTGKRVLKHFRYKLDECNSVLRCVQERRYLLDLGLHGGGDGCRGDELEGGRSVVGILSGKLYHQVNLMAAEVSRHHTATVHRVHLRHTKHFSVMSRPV